ncbi:hypothetical protein [Enterobacter kobei]|uniref:hypothetical protein n=1 Tax=Enterobacter kobei TaxID=208224 RepID=UPI0039C9928A
MIDPRTPEGRLTLRYRGLRTSLLLSMLGLDKDATDNRPFYSRNELRKVRISHQTQKNAYVSD